MKIEEKMKQEGREGR